MTPKNASFKLILVGVCIYIESKQKSETIWYEKPTQIAVHRTPVIAWNRLAPVPLIFGGIPVEKKKYSTSSVETDTGTFQTTLQISSLSMVMCKLWGSLSSFIVSVSPLWISVIHPNRWHVCQMIDTDNKWVYDPKTLWIFQEIWLCMLYYSRDTNSWTSIIN